MERYWDNQSQRKGIGQIFFINQKEFDSRNGISKKEKIKFSCKIGSIKIFLWHHASTFLLPNLSYSNLNVSRPSRTTIITLLIWQRRFLG